MEKYSSSTSSFEQKKSKCITGWLLSWGNPSLIGRDGESSKPGLVCVKQENKSSRLIIQSMSAGAAHTAIVLSSGNIYTWGMGLTGRLALGDERKRSKPTKVTKWSECPVQKVDSVSCGMFHTAVVDKKKRLHTVGRGYKGFLGHQKQTNRSTFKLVEALSTVPIRSVACAKLNLGRCILLNGGKDFVDSLLTGLSDFRPPDSIDVVISPPFLYLIDSMGKLDGMTYQIAAQNCGLTNGAFTGEISPEMLVDVKIPWVILGHSERRHKFGETDEGIAAKVTKAQETGLSVIACIGETEEQRESGQTKDVCIRQLSIISEKVIDWNKIVIAYEPVWAIGTGKTATPEQAQEVHKMLRDWLAERYSTDVANATRIIYGGSVKPGNAETIGSAPDIDGYLVGGCSLKVNDFVAIINAGIKSSAL